MSTRSRANPWFRPVVPIAKAILEGVQADARFERRMRPIILGADGEPLRGDPYEEMCKARVRAFVRSRLDTKLVLTARLLDPALDEEVRAICPELPPLDPVTTAELRRVMESLHD
jgi:hypothetical protein